MKIKSFLCLFFISVCVVFPVTLEWCPSPDSTVVGYKIHYGAGVSTNWTPDVVSYPNPEDPCSGVIEVKGSNWVRQYSHVIDVGLNTTYSVTNITKGIQYFFAVTAYDAAGLESDFSNEVLYIEEINTFTNRPPYLSP